MLPAATSPPKLSTLILLSGLSVLSLNMFLPSLSNIAAAFETDYGLVTLSVAGYAAATAVLQVVMGPLSDRFGRRPVLLAAVAIFLVASLGCALSTSIWWFLGFRLLQAVIISGYAVSMAVVRDVAPAQKAASLMGYLAMAWAVAPLIGPSLGGALDGLFGWRASFWTFFGLGVAVLALCWFDLGETNATPSDSIVGQFRSYPDLVRSPAFWGYSVCMAFSIGALYAFLAGIPMVADTVFGLPPAAIGLVMATTTSGFILGSFLCGRLAARAPLATMILAGRLIATAGLAGGLALVLAGIIHPVGYFAAPLLVGLGNGLTMPSASAGAMSVEPRLAGSASGLSGALTVAGGALMSAITGAVLRPDNAAAMLIAAMLASTLVSLAAALYVSRLERTSPRDA
ncbi:multidrug effflux MFS transporter [Microbaculum marinum]|uniref:Bcr/CflA family efflux transporter n=1 Tax=Microbaculum marinum TaxID=1764581 RepID=A0AAW9RQ63_9HYPH